MKITEINPISHIR